MSEVGSGGSAGGRRRPPARRRWLGAVSALAVVAALVAAGLLTVRDAGDHRGRAAATSPTNGSSTGAGSGRAHADPVVPGCSDPVGQPITAPAHATIRGDRSVRALRIALPDQSAPTAWRGLVQRLSSCPGSQLVATVPVQALGDAAVLVTLRQPAGRSVQTFQVAALRSGSVVTAVVVRTPTGWPLAPQRVVDLLRSTAACHGARCAGSPYEFAAPQLQRTSPAGFLAPIDLPVFAGLRSRWAGTVPTGTAGNPAATSCDRAAPLAAGAQRLTARSYVMPDTPALPATFGLDETVAAFRTPAAAAVFVKSVGTAVGQCAARDLSLHARRMGSFTTRVAGRGTSGQAWQVTVDTSPSAAVVFRLAMVRCGAQVAEVRFTPAADADVSPRVFLALANRAAARLAQR